MVTWEPMLEIVVLTGTDLANSPASLGPRATDAILTTLFEDQVS